MKKQRGNTWWKGQAGITRPVSYVRRTYIVDCQVNSRLHMHEDAHSTATFSAFGTWALQNGDMNVQPAEEILCIVQCTRLHAFAHSQSLPVVHYYSPPLRILGIKCAFSSRSRGQQYRNVTTEPSDEAIFCHHEMYPRHVVGDFLSRIQFGINCNLRS